MSGHSKFANIKHKKEKNDAAKPSKKAAALIRPITAVSGT